MCACVCVCVCMCVCVLLLSMEATLTLIYSAHKEQTTMDRKLYFISCKLVPSFKLHSVHYTYCTTIIIAAMAVPTIHGYTCASEAA